MIYLSDIITMKCPAWSKVFFLSIWKVTYQKLHLKSVVFGFRRCILYGIIYRNQDRRVLQKKSRHFHSISCIRPEIYTLKFSLGDLNWNLIESEILLFFFGNDATLLKLQTFAEGKLRYMNLVFLPPWMICHHADMMWYHIYMHHIYMMWYHRCSLR